METKLAHITKISPWSNQSLPVTLSWIAFKVNAHMINTTFNIFYYFYSLRLLIISKFIKLVVVTLHSSALVVSIYHSTCFLLSTLYTSVLILKKQHPVSDYMSAIWVSWQEKAGTMVQFYTLILDCTLDSLRSES